MGAWAELAPAAAGSEAAACPCHPRGQAAGTLLRKQTGTAERGRRGGLRETFHEMSTAMGPICQALPGLGC